MNDGRRREIQDAIDAYSRKVKADPAGARDRLIATGIWNKQGRLTPEYGGEPGGKKRVKARA